VALGISRRFLSRHRRETLSENQSFDPAPSESSMKLNVVDLKGRLTARPNEAAELLGVSRRSIERAIRDGRLRSTKTIGGRLIVAGDVAALAEPPQETLPIAA
jgi:excisionase family DNA binding protein